MKFRPGRGRCHLVPRAAPLAARHTPTRRADTLASRKDHAIAVIAKVRACRQRLLGCRRARSFTPANARGPSADPKVHARDIFHRARASRGADRPFLRLAFSRLRRRAHLQSRRLSRSHLPAVTRASRRARPRRSTARRCRCRPSRERSAPSRLTPPHPASASCCYRTLRRLAGRAAATTTPNRGVGSPPSPRS